MNRSTKLGEEKVSKLLLQFSIPAIIGMLVNALYNVIDRVFIGNSVGYLGLAGVTIIFPMMLIQMAFAMLIGLGGTSLISIKLGEQKKEEAERVVGNAMILLIVAAVVFGAVGLIFMDPLLRIFGASEAIMPYAKDFLTIILWGSLFMFLSFGMNNFIRAEGNPKIAMATMLIGAGLNLVLNPIFIFGFGWGVKGSALSTIISQAASMIWVLGYFFSGKSLLKIHLKSLSLDKEIVKRTIAVGLAPFFMQLAASLVTVLMNTSLERYGGDIAITAMGILNTISMLIMMPIFGINQGAQPIIGYNYGAEKFDRVKKALKLAILAATSIITVGFIVSMAFPAQIIALFGREDMRVIEFGAHALRIVFIFLPLIGMQIVGSNYFQAVGKPRQAMILTLSRQVLILVPLLLILPRLYGMSGILYTGPIADFLSTVITATWLYWELNHLQRRHEEGQEQEA